MFSVLCVLIGRLPDPGVSTPAHLSVAAVGVSFIKIQNEPRGYSSVCAYGGGCVQANVPNIQSSKAIWMRLLCLAGDQKIRKGPVRCLMLN